MPEDRRHPQLLPALSDDIERIAPHPFSVLYLPNMLELLVELCLVDDVPVGCHAVGVSIGLAPEEIQRGVELRLGDRGRRLAALRDFGDPLWCIAPAAVEKNKHDAGQYPPKPELAIHARTKKGRN